MGVLFLINWFDWCLLTEKEIDNYKMADSGVYQIALGNNSFIKYPNGASSIVYVGNAPEGQLKILLKRHICGGGDPLIYEYHAIQKHKLFWRVAVPNEQNITEQSVLDNFVSQFGDLPKCNKEALSSYSV